MRTSAHEEIKFALLMDDTAIRKLWGLMERCGGAVVAKSKCDDGITRHFETLQALLSYENSRRQRVTEIEISATSPPKINASAHIYLRRTSQRYFTLETGDEGITSALRQGLLDAFDDARVWYSVAALNSPAVPLFFLMIMCGAFAPLAFLPKSSSKTTLSLVQFAALFAYVIAIMAAAGLLAFIVEKLRKTYFPILTFAIGQGAARHRQAETLRWTMIGIVASVIVSAVFFLMTLRVS